MRVSTILLALVLLLPVSSRSDVAETFELNVAGNSQGVRSNFFVDAVTHGVDSTGIWLATGKGVNYSFDNGDSWYLYDATNGLPSVQLSAIFSIDNRLWVATNHDTLLIDELFSASDGLSYTDDDGTTWHQVNFGPDGLDFPYVTGGPNHTIFDITGHTDVGFFNNRENNPDAHWLFFSAWAGSLVASQDGGNTWRRVFPFDADSAAYYSSGTVPDYHLLSFSCVVDTTHGDSLYLWTGTAAGLFQYVFVTPREKFYSRQINKIALCDTCSIEDSGYVFIGGENGLSRTTTTGGPFRTRFDHDGLWGQSVTALINVGGYLVMGVVDTTADTSAVIRSTDHGDVDFQLVTPAEFNALSSPVSDFAFLNGHLYMAAGEAGLFVSDDTGGTWSHFEVQAPAEAATNHVNAIDTLGDTLLLGTDSGYVELRLDINGDTLSTFHQVFADDDTSSARIIRVRHQHFLDTLGLIDSTIIWTVHQPMDTLLGIHMIGHSRWVVDTPDTNFVSLHYWLDQDISDINCLGDSTFTVGADGIHFTTDGSSNRMLFHANQYWPSPNDTLVRYTLDADSIVTMEVKGDTVVFGTRQRIAISTDRAGSFRISRANTDSMKADVVIQHHWLSNNIELAGDFIPALGFQYLPDGTGRLWVSGRPAMVGETGISVAEYQTITDGDGDSIGFDLAGQRVLDGDFAWNFEFVDTVTFAATNNGLMMNTGNLDSGMMLVPLVDPVTGEDLVDPGTVVYAVRADSNYLWVGTDDGTVRIDISDLDDLTDQHLFARVDSTTPPSEVYAFPVPFRPLEGGTVDFRFVVDEPGHITLEVYDFAMNLVARLVDNVFYNAGVYPDGLSQGRNWDGRNDNGDIVAVGVYYFVVKYDSGEKRWGKLAVIP